MWPTFTVVLGDVDVYSELCCMKSLHFAMKFFMEMHPMPPAAPADAGEMHFFKFLDWNRARSRGLLCILQG